MVIGIIFATFAGYGLLRFTYRKMKDLENEDPIEISGEFGFNLFMSGFPN